jgi:hypothetical protein
MTGWLPILPKLLVPRHHFTNSSSSHSFFKRHLILPSQVLARYPGWVELGPLNVAWSR